MLLLLLCLVPLAVGDECLGGGTLSSQFKKCYHFVYSPVVFEEASAVCGSIDGRVVSIASAFEQSFVFAHARVRFVLSDYWIGLTKFIDDTKWIWDDGTPLSYEDWQSGTSRNDSSKQCAASHLNNGRWYDVECDAKRYFVCQTNPIPIIAQAVDTKQCAPQSDPGDAFNKCYLPINSGQSYQGAELTCGSLQGSLVTIANPNELTLVTASARQHMPRMDYWIGLNRIYDGINWQWTGDTSQSTFNWASGFPSNAVNLSCVAAKSSNTKWYNCDCDMATSFVCELPPFEVLKATDLPPLPTIRPGSEWIYYPVTNAWYKAVQIHQPSSWEWHEQNCVSQGSHLSSVHSLQENVFILGMVMGDAYCDYAAIGLKSYTGNLNAFRWTDKTEVDFTYWNGGNPQTANYFCNKLHYNSRGLWENTPCLEAQNYLCSVCKKTA